jgi:hypothetical protein
MEDPRFEKFKSDIALPNRTAERRDREEPSETQSRTEIIDPQRVKLLKLSEEPRFV